jgi:ferredoxin
VARVKVSVDRDVCIVSGMCTSIAPEIFQIGDDGLLHILLEELTPELAERADNAVLCCPVEALSLRNGT